MNWKNSARLSAVLALLFAVPAFAEEAAKEPSTYSPPACEFSITFPSEPYTTRHCDEGDKDKCYDQISYTQVYDFESTINFRVICNPIDKEIYDHYSDEVMLATLRAMTDKSVVKTFDTSTRTEDGYKQAGLVGEGKSGTLPTIYIAQLWIGRGSAFSVEAEMIGEPHEKADKLFSEILKSVHFLSDEEKKAKLPAEKKAKEKAKKDAENKEEGEANKTEPKKEE